MGTSVFLELTHDIKNDKFKTNTSVKEELLDDFLADFARRQMGAGEDTSTPNKQDVYHIRITLDLSDDTFFVKSDTGNKSLTCGIVMHYAGTRKPG